VAIEKESTAHAKNQKQFFFKRKKVELQQEKAKKAQKKQERTEAKEANQHYKDYWKEVAAKGWGNNLQLLMKSNEPPLPSMYLGVYRTRWAGSAKIK
jgi:hypothetical protein